MNLKLIAKVFYNIGWVALAFYTGMSIFVWVLGTGLASGLFLTGTRLPVESYYIGYSIMYFTLTGMLTLILFIVWNSFESRYNKKEVDLK